MNNKLEIIFTSAAWEDHADFLTILFSEMEKNIECHIKADYGGDVKRLTMVLVSISYDDKKNSLFAQKQTKYGYYFDIDEKCRKIFVSIGYAISPEILEKRDLLEIKKIFIDGIKYKIANNQCIFPKKFNSGLFYEDLTSAFN